MLLVLSFVERIVRRYVCTVPICLEERLASLALWCICIYIIFC
jgi:hypothetical protein